MRFNRLLLALLLLLVGIAPASMLLAQDEETAEIQNDEGGPTLVTGEVTYTLGFFAELWLNPYILLTDVSGSFVDRNFDFTPAVQSQTLGYATSDPATSPFTYELALPAVPRGEFRDVDNDGEEDQGVQIFMLGITDNLWGDPFVEERDFFFYGYTSGVISDDAATYNELEGGKIIIYAADDTQAFPTAFGEDGLLFTEDDPTASVPAGYTVVDLDTDPFTFDRAATVTIPLLESEGNQQDDFSDLTYTEAFLATIEKLRVEYAFTELKNLDWDAIRDEFLPLFEEAEANEDNLAYRRALLAFANSIPDGHMFGPFIAEDFEFQTGGGTGMAIRELSDGRVIVTYVLEGSPAAEAGIEVLAEITAVNGTPIEEAVSAIEIPFTASTDPFRRYQQFRYLLRAPVGTEFEITFQNPDASEPTTATVATIAERNSFSQTSINQGLSGTELPVEFEILDNGYGYVKIYSFFDDLPLTTRLWERAMATFVNNNVPGVILDLRQNGGGFTDVGYQMMAYFFNEELFIELESVYDESIGEFYLDERNAVYFDLPAEELRYNGPVTVLVSQACASACEFVARAMTLNERADVVGYFATQGIAGGWQPFFLPDGEELPAIIVRTLDEDGNVIIEGEGVVPTIPVPITEETLFSEGDPILDAAVARLDELTAIEVSDGGEIAVGEEVTGTLEARARTQYTLNVSEGDRLNIILEDEAGELDTVLYVYLEGNPDPILSNDDAEDASLVNGQFNSALVDLEIPQDLTLIVEVATYNDEGAGDYILRVEAVSGGATEETEGGAEGEEGAESEGEATEEAEATEGGDMSGEAMAATIYEALQNNPDLASLLQAVDLAGAAEALSGEGEFTLFAPSNDAFAAFIENNPDTVNAAMGDPAILTDLLLYHVVAGVYLAEDVVGLDGQEVPTLSEGNSLLIEVGEDGTVTVNGLTVLTTDITTGNGVIHIIDGVLLPASE